MKKRSYISHYNSQCWICSGPISVTADL